MLGWSAWTVAAAALGGLVLVALSQGPAPLARLRWPGWLHGAVGVAGFALLLAGLAGAPRSQRAAAAGAGSFGWVAAGFLAGAVALGLLVLAARLRRRPPSVLALGVHASLAVGGLVMLAAFLAA